MLQRLRLPWTQTHASIQGISNVNTSTGHSVSIHLRSRHTGWHTTLDCAVLPNITGMTPATKLNTTDWKIPTDIKLADEHFHQPGNIDLLIGADLFYEISTRQTHTSWIISFTRNSFRLDCSWPNFTTYNSNIQNNG